MSARIDGPILFNKFSLYAGLQQKEAELKERLRSLDSRQVEQESTGAALFDEFVAHTPEMHSDRMEILGQRETKQEVSDYGRRITVTAQEIVIGIPFDGDSGFFGAQPSTWSTSPPRGQVDKRLLRITVIDPSGSDPAEIRKIIDREVASIKEYLSWVRNDVERYNTGLRTTIDSGIKQRADALAATKSRIEGLGIPMRAAGAQGQAQLKSVARALPEPNLGNARALKKQYDVFISHASEDKDGFVRPLAAALRDRGLEVWYDEFTLKMGDSLRKTIDQGLANSRYGVVVLSPSFFGKNWPEKELGGLTAKESNGTKVILPVWHGVDHKQVAAYSPMLADLLAAISDKGVEYVAEEVLKVIRGTD